MRLSLRFVIPLAIALTLIAYAVVPLVDKLTLTWSIRDMDIRSRLVANTLGDALEPLLATDNDSKVMALFRKATLDERLYAIGYCAPESTMSYRSENFPVQIGCTGSAGQAERSLLVDLPQGPLHVAVIPLAFEQIAGGALVVVHDMSFVGRRSASTKKYIFYFFALLALVISLITVVIAQLSWKGWVRGIRSLLKGEGLVRRPMSSTAPELQPIFKDLRALVRDLEADKVARDVNQIVWNPQALREILHDKLAGDEIIIVSNREPYIHNWVQGKISVQTPASGLVTALEPVMRACSGTWIAHGSGSADRDVVDRHDKVPVPPVDPAYHIRRVWLTPEEEAGYYYGFSNEGLWPLCHIAHTRPTFRSEDWERYVAVNEKFCRAVVAEAKTDDPVVWVQDYHLALLPRLIKNALPNATVITFWHIPWPNAEAFGICPWRDALLDGLLGSTILGFHTRFHCNNFNETVERFLECRIDKETSTISYGGKLTAVNQYPISIEWPSERTAEIPSVAECRRLVRESNGLAPEVYLGVGVDRLDYTKGILERLRALDRFYELNPAWRGKFAFVQIAAPSRSAIPQYQAFENEVRSLASQINERWRVGDFEPVILKVEHHEARQVFAYYRGADLCLVTSLHDGMNLVAKEFVAARDDERGVVILSQFTGASRELPEALIVNPYDTDQTARALRFALEMPQGEQRDRMQSMRGLIKQFNVYRWAGRMLIDASRIRARTRLLGRWEDAYETGEVLKV